MAKNEKKPRKTTEKSQQDHKSKSVQPKRRKAKTEATAATSTQRPDPSHAKKHTTMVGRVLKRRLVRSIPFPIQTTVFCLIVIILFLKVTNYTHLHVATITQWPQDIATAYDNTTFAISELKYVGSCPKGEEKITIGVQFVCRAPDKLTGYQNAFDTYPRNPNGNEDIFATYMDSYSIKTANDFLKNQYDVPTYKPMTLTGVPTWKEDPYSASYWRYNFYSLRIFKDLLNANMATNNPQYATKLVSILDSFLATGIHQPHAWDNDHAVAWRTIFLTDAWWKLRQHNELPISTSNAVLAALEQHGTFLLQANHFQPDFNEAVDEAAALYQLGVAFPTLPNAVQWRTVGAARLASTTKNLVNGDGALTDHSTYYDFQALDTLWAIQKYADAYHTPISTTFNAEMKAMANYAAYILQPNGHVPLIGASLDKAISDRGDFAQIAQRYPKFAYAITQGKSGIAPKATSVQFKKTGQTVMRSSWSRNNYKDQTQVIFNYGAYQTSHSNLAALSFQLYSGGSALMPGPGLYTYAPGALRDYFHGTASENTVLVDGKSQIEGTGHAGKFIQGNGFVSQSAADQLNPGVTQERQLTLIGAHTLVVIDKLHSASLHTYQQLFHLYPGAHFSSKGLTVHVPGATPAQNMSITQLVTNGVSLSSVYNNRSNNPGGLCSQQYGQLLPCYQIQYTQKSQDATFVSVIQLGQKTAGTTYHLHGSTLTLSQNGRTYTLNIHEAAGQVLSATATHTKAPTPVETPINTMQAPAGWSVKGGTLQPSQDTWHAGTPSLALSNTVGNEATMTEPVNLNLTNKNLLVRVKIPNIQSMSGLNLVMRSNSTSYAAIKLQDAYDLIHDNDQSGSSPSASGPDTTENEWDTISLALGSNRSQQDEWQIHGAGFSWSNITSIEFQLIPKTQQPTTALLGTLSTFPAQSEGKVAIIFDDGSSSILPAVDTMSKYGYKGSVAVIGKYPGTSLPGYLSIQSLLQLKKKGWSLINHTYYHQNAVTQYYDKHNLSGYEADVLEGAAFLKNNGLDTDDNWFIYPHGATNSVIQQIISKYYMFARSEFTAPEAFPFGSPLAVKDFVVADSTKPQDVELAIKDANIYHQTLLLTFHRIHTNSASQSGYGINNFNQIVQYLHQTHSNVMSLNQLDRSNGVPVNTITIQQQKPSQLDGAVQVKGASFWYRLLHSI